MGPKNKKYESTIAPAGILGLLLAGLWHQPTGAQAPLDRADDRLDEVVVTGSRIPRRDFSAPSPIVSLDAAELRLAGTTNVEELLNTLPQVVPDRGRTTNVGAAIATVNLRGLGANRTLIMLNGRRFSASTISGAVDVNNIPAALIERAEVVTGGASAVYGSDAVVGVVNFIIDEKFDGITVDTQYEITHERDGEVFDLSMTGGTAFAAGRGHIAGFFNYNDRAAIAADQREFTTVLLQDDTRTGEIVESGSSAVPEGAILFPSTIIDGEPVRGVIFNQDGTLRPMAFPDDLYNFNPANYLQVPLKRYVAGGFLEYDFALGLRGELEAMYARNEISQQLAPSPVSFFGAVSIDNPFLPPETQQILSDSFDPDGDGFAEFFMRRRVVENGPRRVEDTRDVLRLLAALSGDMTDTWRWETYYSYTETDIDPLWLNAVSQSRFVQAVLIDPVSGGCLDPTGGCVPANIYGAGNISPAAIEFIRFETIEPEEKLEEQVASLVVRGPVAEFPAGMVGMAGGLEWRRLEGTFVPDPASLTNDVVGVRAFQPAVGATEVSEIFAEILVPLLADRPFARYLAVEAGGRYSDYNTAGSVETWKLGAEWVLADGLRIRAMYQNAIRAPSVLEIFEVPAEFILDRFGAETDLCSASRDPVGNGLTDVCIAQGMDPALLGVFEAPDPNFVTFFTGGNLGLRPEESESVTLGVVLQPPNIEGLSMSVDYFDIEIEDAILDIQAGALAACFEIKEPTSDFCTAYVRDASGRIAEANNFPRNVARQRSEGFDLQLEYSAETPSLALLDGATGIDVSFIGTWYMTNGSQSSPLTPFFDCAGYFGFTCAFSNFGSLPELKTTTRLTYSSGPLQTSLRWRWIDGMKNSEPFFTQLFDLPDPVLAIPEIGSRSYVDLSATFGLSENWLIYGGITNLFNTDPPLLGSAAPGLNTDHSTFDTIGRRYFLGIRYGR